MNHLKNGNCLIKSKCLVVFKTLIKWILLKYRTRVQNGLKHSTSTTNKKSTFLFFFLLTAQHNFLLLLLYSFCFGVFANTASGAFIFVYRLLNRSPYFSLVVHINSPFFLLAFCTHLPVHFGVFMHDVCAHSRCQQSLFN